MRRCCALVLLFLAAGMAFASSYSYVNNTFQKLAEEYAQKSAVALDEGEYAMSVDYAQKAIENAELSEAFVRQLVGRSDAEEMLARAKARLDYAASIHADVQYPVAYNAASDYYRQAQDAFAREDYSNAVVFAQKVLDTLADIQAVSPLPKFYIVQPWELSRDCLWNISGRTYVYNNPWLWRHLYEANRDALPDPDNPNLILPGMKLEIPSITGEYRSGTYDPKKTYGTYSPN